MNLICPFCLHKKERNILKLVDCGGMTSSADPSIMVHFVEMYQCDICKTFFERDNGLKWYKHDNES